MDPQEHRPRLRPARVLLGWMAPTEAHLAQASRREEDAGRPEYELRASRARLVAGSRRPAIDARDVVSEPPASLRDFIASFEAHPRSSQITAEGWRVALVDLRRVCAMQPHVFTDAAVPDVHADDLEAIAGVTLQPPVPTRIAPQYEQERRTWIIAAPGPNFRIGKEFQTEIEPGVLGLGFELRIYGSFVQAVRFRDRYVLRDGYHRAVAFLSRGIDVVPALVREAATLEEIHMRRGMLSSDIVFGPGPPLLPDYLDDEVSAAVELPAVRRVLTIQATDLPVYD